MKTKELNGYKIEFYSEEEWKDYPYNILLEIRKLEGLYAGLVSDISEELAEKIVDKQKSNDKVYYFFEGYYTYKPKYSLEPCVDMSIKTAKQSFQTLSDLPYCVVTKTE